MNERHQNVYETDPIIGDWQFPNNNIMSFRMGGQVMPYGQRVALWKRVKDPTYFIAYLQGNFRSIANTGGWNIANRIREGQ